MKMKFIGIVGFTVTVKYTKLEVNDLNSVCTLNLYRYFNLFCYYYSMFFFFFNRNILHMPIYYLHKNKNYFLKIQRSITTVGKNLQV